MKNSATIIPVSSVDCQVISWKNHLKSAISNTSDLLRYLNISSTQEQRSLQTNFAVRVPIPFANKMEKGNINDPLLLQVLATQDENLKVDGYSHDPLKEQINNTPGLLHKYHGRVLLLLTGSCAINCRYCFRRHFPYNEQVALGANLSKNLTLISDDESISEVILSGGDPLLLSDKALAEIILQIESISHVRRLRIHSRLPIVIPERLTPELKRCLSSSRLQCSLVIHANHANEIDPVLGKKLSALAQSGVTLFNQSVLLKQINDQAKILADLSEKLFEYQVVPYYIHLLDPVEGAAHFAIKESAAITIMQQLSKMLPGYLLPKLVKEEAYKKSKTIIF